MYVVSVNLLSFWKFEATYVEVEIFATAHYINQLLKEYSIFTLQD